MSCKVKHVKVLSSAAARAQHTAAYSKAKELARLPGAAAQAQHTEECICTWHIILVCQQEATAQAQHTAAYIDTQA